MTGPHTPPGAIRAPGTYGGLTVSVSADARTAGALAGRQAAALLAGLLAARDEVRVAFAAAPSQDATLDALAAADGIDWSRVTAFQLDDYVGLATGAPGTFSRYLDEHLFGRVRPGRVEYMSLSGDAEAEAARYGALAAERPLDLALLGIGENGHLAFNDPPDADRHDPRPARLVRLDEVSRAQQVNDGCFPALDLVPRQALTLTLPTILGAGRIVCTVPGPRKRDAVERALTGPVNGGSPASYLREHPATWLYLDTGAHPGTAP
ncbi:6-phosphogluconolactonase [Nonomuraea jiangxiensis]|uniref:Glucosamine-6-phosphate deaminase n=1 Tax=Nonomuraea jiangxiensis TaxID=633440 RepID=A0A1G9BGF0_9ACTN|nr:6-phosphogluconolactonase [Nonomuraea jiangxiensis]SDK38134.1 glucosamine-6-phosphate deaminase [Nonomuraea jiangxiensis]